MLFISGMSVKSGHAVENLKKICNAYLKDNFELQIIDISREPLYATEYQLVAIPTLITTNLHGHRKIILGDLSDTEKVLRILEIS
jgi:circadian clock protein KaiB